MLKWRIKNNASLRKITLSSKANRELNAAMKIWWTSFMSGRLAVAWHWLVWSLVRSSTMRHPLEPRLLRSPGLRSCSFSSWFASWQRMFSFHRERIVSWKMLQRHLSELKLKHQMLFPKAKTRKFLPRRNHRLRETLSRMERKRKMSEGETRSE